ncbi:MAG: hypothetical protein ACUVX8_17985, partial [Candidatus Zipacnadales bacterium]
MTERTSPSWLLWGTLVLIVLAQTQAALAKDLKDGPFVSAADVFAALLFAGWGLWTLGTGAWRRLKWPPLAAWVLVVVALVAVGRADSREALKSGVVDVAQYVLYFLGVYLLFLNALRDESALRRAVALLCIMTCVMVLVGLVQYLTVANIDQPDSFRQVSSTFGIGDTIAQTSLGEKLHLVGRSSRSIYCNFLLLVLPILFVLGLAGPMACWVRAGV